MNSKMEKLIKKLTKSQYRKMLFYIGSSKKPPSSYQVMKGTQTSRYAYRMLKILSGLPDGSNDKIVPSGPNYHGIRHMLGNSDVLLKDEPVPRFLQITVDPKHSHDRRKWRYNLNFRGLLLYMLSESLEGRKNHRRIRQVLSNIAISHNFPFLTFWQVFEKSGFDVIGTLQSLAVELQNQLDRDEDYLLQRASERYFMEFNNYFDFLQSPLGFRRYCQRVSPDTDAKILEYRNLMFRILKSYLESDLMKLEKEIMAYAT